MRHLLQIDLIQFLLDNNLKKKIFKRIFNQNSKKLIFKTSRFNLSKKINKKAIIQEQQDQKNGLNREVKMEQIKINDYFI